MVLTTAVYQFHQVDVYMNLSQLIRSNTSHYWSHMKSWADLHYLQHYLPFGGMLAGDPHMGNFAVLPLKSPLASPCVSRHRRRDGWATTSDTRS
jgi:hypothetical protein